MIATRWLLKLTFKPSIGLHSKTLSILLVKTKLVLSYQMRIGNLRYIRILSTLE